MEERALTRTCNTHTNDNRELRSLPRNSSSSGEEAKRVVEEENNIHVTTDELKEKRVNVKAVMSRSEKLIK